jgi:hypothetical protein
MRGKIIRAAIPAGIVSVALGPLPVTPQQPPPANPDRWPRPIKISNGTVVVY